MGLEIERKFTVKNLPENLEDYPVRIIEQGYLNVIPAIRVRREDDHYYMTYKSRKGFGDKQTTDNSKHKAGSGNCATPGLDNGEDSSFSEDIGKTEYNLPLDRDSYEHLVKKADGNVIRKKRYIISLNSDAYDRDFADIHPDLADKISHMKIELDVFEAPFEGRILAEVEFPDEDFAKAYRPAEWFLEDVTGNVRYSNAHMSSEVL